MVPRMPCVMSAVCGWSGSWLSLLHDELDTVVTQEKPALNFVEISENTGEKAKNRRCAASQDVTAPRPQKMRFPCKILRFSDDDIFSKIGPAGGPFHVMDNKDPSRMGSLHVSVVDILLHKVPWFLEQVS